MNLDLKLEPVILSALVRDGEFAVKVLPYIEPTYFKDVAEKYLFEQIRKFQDQHQRAPSFQILAVELRATKTVQHEGIYKSIMDKLKEIALLDPDKENRDWLVSSTEKWCKLRALYSCASEMLALFDDDTKLQNAGSVIESFEKAVAISFDPKVGHDYVADAEERFEYYNREKRKIPFDITLFNEITSGGVEEESVSVLAGGTYVGKTLFKCHMAAAHLNLGYNVLYITLEMASMKIATRIDANLLDIPMRDVERTKRDVFLQRIEAIRNKTRGILKIEGFPTSEASILHFQKLLNDLYQKQRFRPDVIYIDYLNICASSRYKFEGNTYVHVKAIIEEIRALAIRNSVAIITSTQNNKEAQGSGTIRLQDIAESWGTPQTADMVLGLMVDEELKEMGQVKVFNLKNRFRDANDIPAFVVGVDRKKMRLYDVDVSPPPQKAVKTEKDDTPVFDNSKAGESIKSEKRANYVDWEIDDEPLI